MSRRITFRRLDLNQLAANTQFLSPRLFMNNGATAAAITYDCAGV